MEHWLTARWQEDTTLFVMMRGENKQTNKTRGWNGGNMYRILSQKIIVSVCEGRGGKWSTWGREGGKNLRISSLCLWPAPDSGAKLSLRRRSTLSSTFHLSSLGEHTEDHTKVHCTILWLSLHTHTHTDLFKSTGIKMTTRQEALTHCCVHKTKTCAFIRNR